MQKKAVKPVTIGKEDMVTLCVYVIGDTYWLLYSHKLEYV